MSYYDSVKRLGFWFDLLWLPAFLLLSTTWLFAPALHHAHYGQLAVISAYEAVGQPWAWLFRLCDIAGSFLVLVAVWRYAVIRRDRTLGLMLLAIAVLATVDGLFPHACAGVCSPLARLSGFVHDGESALLAVVVWVSALTVWLRSRRWLSLVFLGGQLLVGVLALGGLLSHNQLMAVHYVYELSIVAWVGWLLSGFAPRLPFSVESQALVRRLFGWLTLTAGVLVLASAALHRNILGPLFGELTERMAHMPWLSQHGVFAGLLLLYIARQVARGQRRAALLLAAVLSWLVVVYALYQPRPLLLGLCLLLLVLLWRFGNAFRRNVGPLPVSARLKDFAVVLVGVVVAAGVVVGLAVAVHKQQILYRDVARAYRHGASGFARREDRISEHVERDIRRTASALGVGLVTLLVWTLFRPSGQLRPPHADEHVRAARLLKKYSNSSEDFFKLWPEDKKYFFSAANNGFVAYKVVRSVAFALADPIADETNRQPLLQEFTDFCKANGWRSCFLLVQESSASLHGSSLKLFRIGSSAVINVQEFAANTVRDKWWRWQANRAARSGLRYEAYQPPHNQMLVSELQAVSDSWLIRGSHVEQGFALGYFDKDYLQRCVVHVLRDASGRAVAFANELPVYKEDAQRTVDLIRFVPDVDGAMPVLLMFVLEAMHKAGDVKTFDLGFVPLAKLDSTLASIAKRLGANRFSAAGLEQFKGKFRPEWRPNYIAYDGDLLDLVVVLAALERALAK